MRSDQPQINEAAERYKDDWGKKQPRTDGADYGDDGGRKPGCRQRIDGEPSELGLHTVKHSPRHCATESLWNAAALVKFQSAMAEFSVCRA